MPRKYPPDVERKCSVGLAEQSRALPVPSHGEARFAPDHPGVGNILRSFEIAAILPALPQVDWSASGMRILPMYRIRLGTLDLSTGLTFFLAAAACYSAWLTSIVFCAAHGERPLLIAAAAFFPVGILPGRHRPRYRHLVRRLVIWINVPARESVTPTAELFGCTKFAMPRPQSASSNGC